MDKSQDGKKRTRVKREALNPKPNCNIPRTTAAFASQVDAKVCHVAYPAPGRCEQTTRTELKPYLPHSTHVIKCTRSSRSTQMFSGHTAQVHVHVLSHRPQLSVVLCKPSAIHHTPLGSGFNSTSRASERFPLVRNNDVVWECR